MNLTLDQWLGLDVESRARHLLISSNSSDQPAWATDEILISELYDLHPDGIHDRRVYVDLAGIDFLGAGFLRSFYDSRGYCPGSEHRSAAELRELRSCEQFGNSCVPDLGHDLDHDAKVEEYIRSLVVRDLSTLESAVHEEMLARGQAHAYVDTFEIEFSTERGASSLVLVLVRTSSGHSLSLMPWDDIADWKELLDGDWVELGSLEDDCAPLRSWDATWDEFGDDSGSSDDLDPIDAQGMDLSLPEPDEATPAEEASWRDQLIAEYDDDSPDDVQDDEPANGRATRDEVDPEAGLEWKL